MWTTAGGIAVGRADEPVSGGLGAAAGRFWSEADIRIVVLGNQLVLMDPERTSASISYCCSEAAFGIIRLSYEVCVRWHARASCAVAQARISIG